MSLFVLHGTVHTAPEVTHATNVLGPELIIVQFTYYTQATLEGHCHPSPFAWLHLDHWAVCCGRGREGLCVPLCHWQCVSGEGYCSRSIYATVKKEDGMRAVIPCMNAHSFLHTSYVRMYVHLYIQGLFIFLLHVLRHEKVYGKIKDKLPNISKLVSIVKYIYIHIYIHIHTYVHIHIHTAFKL